MSEWLNQSFSNLDGAVFSFTHSVAVKAGGFFTPFSLVLAIMGKGGMAFLILGAILLLFYKTRKSGLTILLAIGVGALLTNVLIKNLVARPRPYNANSLYQEFWQFVGGHTESEYSFPSGHVTVTMTSMTALFLTMNKKWSFLGFVLVVLMAFSRIYLTVHYFTDVVGGVLIGGIAGTIGYFLGKIIFNAIEKKQENKFCKFCLNADIKNLFIKKKTN